MACGLLDWYIWLDFVKDAVAEHKLEMKVKEEEIERLKKGRTLPETESKVQILQLCLKDHLYLFLMKEFKDAFFLWLIIIISRQKMFFYYKYILKGFKFEFLKCFFKKRFMHFYKTSFA